MKNFIFAAAIASISVFAGINGANAQKQASSGFDKNNLERMSDANYFFGGGDISPRALRNFEKSYKNVTSENWEKIKNGYCVNFFEDSKKNAIFYDSRGEWFGSLITYNESKLPFEIRDLVKSRYYDYSIFFVEEVQTVESNGVPTYIIHLEDKKAIKLIRVNEGQMEAWREYVKS